MLSAFSLIQQLPAEEQKSFRTFISVYFGSVILLVLIFGSLYAASVIYEQPIFRTAASSILVGLFTTTIVGASAVKCINRMAKQSDEKA